MLTVTSMESAHPMPETWTGELAGVNITLSDPFCEIDSNVGYVGVLPPV